MAEVVTTIASSSDDLRARVVRLASGAFAVEIQRRFDAVDAGGESHGRFWGTVSYPRSFFDGVEPAVEFAEAALRREVAGA
jgi:hypothetical protein